jgi:hypothetical protein
MGASEIAFAFDGKNTKADIERKFKKMSDEAAYARGHEYSGSWNMFSGVSFPNTDVFDSRSTAENWIYDNSDKRGDALCVRFKGVKNIFVSTPTFGGKKPEPHGYYKGSFTFQPNGNQMSHLSGKAILYTKIDYETIVGYHQQEHLIIEPADQLTKEEKETALNLYKKYRDSKFICNAMSWHWPEWGFSNVTLEQLREASEIRKTAETAWCEFEKTMIEKLWKTEDEPYEAWIMGGLAAD